MDARIRQVARRCKRRLGDCGCVIGCEAVTLIDKALIQLRIARNDIEREITDLENTRLRLNTNPATSRPEVIAMCPEGCEPVMVFDAGEAYFGFEDCEGEWIECSEWPFVESQRIWPDDCERAGIRVE